jgi:hypothetical protein
MAGNFMTMQEIDKEHPIMIFPFCLFSKNQKKMNDEYLANLNYKKQIQNVLLKSKIPDSKDNMGRDENSEEPEREVSPRDHFNNDARKNKNVNKSKEKLQKSKSVVSGLLNSVQPLSEEDLLYFYSKLTSFYNYTSNNLHYRVAPVFREYNPRMLDFMSTMLKKNQNENNSRTSSEDSTSTIIVTEQEKKDK